MVHRLVVSYGTPTDTAAFDTYYRDTHTPIALKQPGLLRLSFGHAQSLDPAQQAPYLVAELFWPSEDAFKASAATPEMAEARNHAESCGTTFTADNGHVAEV